MVRVKMHSMRLIRETDGKYETRLSVSGPTVTPQPQIPKYLLGLLTTHP
jgi:hypothetical protein